MSLRNFRLMIAGICVAAVIVWVAMHDNGRRDPAPVTTSGLVACLTEDGATAGQNYPCVWDGALMGNGQYTGPRFLIYGDPSEFRMPAAS